MSVAYEREKKVDAVKLAVVLLAAFTVWECIRTVNMFVQEEKLVTAERVVKGANDFVAGIDSGSAALDKIREVLRCHADVLVAAFFALGMAALLARTLFASPMLDYLYLESPARDRRTMFGFLFTGSGLLLQVALLYAMVIFARPEKGLLASGMVPFLLVLYFAGGAMWLLLMCIGAKRDDKHALRGLWPAFAVNTGVAALLIAALWYVSRKANHDPAQFHGNPHLNVSVAGLAALVACTLDTLLQGRLYGRTGKGSALRTVLQLLGLLILLAFGAYLVYLTGPFGNAGA